MTLKKSQINEIIDAFQIMFPDAFCELKHSNPFELVIAVLLSAQCTDVMVNKVTATLFQKYKTPEDYLAVEIETLMEDIKQIGLFRNKAKHIQQLCHQLLQNYDGVVPSTREELVTLAGVGRKTANVVISTAFGVPAFAVDTHVERVAKRLGLAKIDDDVMRVETKVMKLFPESMWTALHHQMIFFGRYHCKAQKPGCDVCPLLHLCKEGKQRMGIPLRKRKNVQP